MNLKKPAMIFTVVLCAAALLHTSVRPAVKGDKPSQNYRTYLMIGQYDGGGIVYGDAIEILGFSHSLMIPRDAASGLPTGHLQHQPVTVRKVIDRNSPQLISYMVGVENLDSVKLVVENVTPEGMINPIYTIELINANVSKVSQTGDELLTEEAVFYYQKIIWTWLDGGLTTEADWESPVV